MNKSIGFNIIPKKKSGIHQSMKSSKKIDRTDRLHFKFCKHENTSMIHMKKGYPHYAKECCDNCDYFIRWLPFPQCSHIHLVLLKTPNNVDFLGKQICNDCGKFIKRISRPKDSNNYDNIYNDETNNQNKECTNKNISLNFNLSR